MLCHQAIFGFCMLFCSSFLLGKQSNELRVNPEDLVNGFRLNYYKFKSLRVSWQSSNENGNEWFREKQAQILLCEKVLKTTTDDKERKEVETILRIRRGEVQSPKSKMVLYSHFDFWSDRNRFQIRSVSDLTGHWFKKTIPNKFEFPDLANVQNSLATSFKDISILSFNGDLKSGFQTWTGVLGGLGSGSVSTKAPEAVSGWLFPPMGINSELWSPKSTWNKIDQFFSLPIEGMSVIGVDNLKGKETYLLAYNKVNENLERSFTPELIKKYPNARRHEKTVAWVDPTQGYLPLQIAYYHDFTFKRDEKAFTKSKDPDTLIEIERIEPVAGGGFYSARGVETFFAYSLPTAELIDQLTDLEGGILGKYSHGSLGTYQKSTWESTIVDARREMNAEMFDLIFPQNSVYFDQTTQKVMSTQESVKNMEDALTDTSSTKSITRRFLLMIMVLVVFGTLFYLKVRKKAT